jgi:predicted enzyme related to lactoylglutathione lyase
MAPMYGNGKICYIELPATDVKRSAEFYRRVFGWNIRTRGDGATSFDDTTGEVSGAWVVDRPPSTDPGMVVYVMVADAAAASKAIVDAGGQIVRPIDPDSPEIFAHFSDPARNVLGIYQDRSAADARS